MLSRIRRDHVDADERHVWAGHRDNSLQNNLYATFDPYAPDYLGTVKAALDHIMAQLGDLTGIDLRPVGFTAQAECRQKDPGRSQSGSRQVPDFVREKWSGREDSNLRPLRPQHSALPG